MLSRRFFIGSLLAMPAVVASGNLMKIRGVTYDPIVRVQSWPPSEQAYGPWWVHQGPLSKAGGVEAEMKQALGTCFSRVLPPSQATEAMMISAIDLDAIECPLSLISPSKDGRLERFGIRPTKAEFDERRRTLSEIIPAPARTGRRQLIRTPEEYEASIATMETDLHKISTWGSGGMSVAAMAVLTAPSKRQRMKPELSARAKEFWPSTLPEKPAAASWRVSAARFGLKL